MSTKVISMQNNGKRKADEVDHDKPTFSPFFGFGAGLNVAVVPPKKSRKTSSDSVPRKSGGKRKAKAKSVVDEEIEDDVELFDEEEAEVYAKPTLSKINKKDDAPKEHVPAKVRFSAPPATSHSRPSSESEVFEPMYHPSMTEAQKKIARKLKNLSVIIDSREKPSGSKNDPYDPYSVLEVLAESGLDGRRECLPAGDIAIVSRGKKNIRVYATIERKTYPDLWSSITKKSNADGSGGSERVASQLVRMSKSGVPFCYLLVVGQPTDIRYGSKDIKAARAACRTVINTVTLKTRKSVSLMSIHSNDELAPMIISFALRLVDNGLIDNTFVDMIVVESNLERSDDSFIDIETTPTTTSSSKGSLDCDGNGAPPSVGIQDFYERANGMRKVNDHDSFYKNMIIGIQNVSPKKFDKIKEEYPTLPDLLDTLRESRNHKPISKVEGVGEALAKKIYELLLPLL